MHPGPDESIRALANPKKKKAAQQQEAPQQPLPIHPGAHLLQQEAQQQPLPIQPGAHLLQSQHLRSWSPKAAPSQIILEPQGSSSQSAIKETVF